MGKIKMIAVRRHRYGTTWYDPGDKYDAKNRREALLLEVMKKSIIEIAPAPPPADPAAAKKTTAKKTTAKKSTSENKTTMKKINSLKIKDKRQDSKPVSGRKTKDMKATKKDDEENNPAAEKKNRGQYERRDLRAKE